MACRTLQNIGIDNCTGNKGGIYTEVLFGSRKDFDASIDQKETATDGYPYEVNGKFQNGYVKFAKTGDDFNIEDVHYIKFRKNSSGLTSEGTFDETNGVYFFTNNLALVIARQEVEKRMALQALALADDLAVIVRDGNGKCYFLGLDDTVSTTAMTAQTGTANTDGNNYTVTLTDTSNELPFFVTESDWNALVELAEPAGSGNGQ